MIHSKMIETTNKRATWLSPESTSVNVSLNKQKDDPSPTN